ncbi:MAG: replication endonuclease [Sedimenticola sp.]|nr:replication endonuclease [Sedimenticola sp.]
MYCDWSRPRAEIYAPPPFDIPEAVERLWRDPNATDGDRFFIHNQLRHYPKELASAIATKYKVTKTQQGKQQANLDLLRQSKKLQSFAKLLSITDEEIRNIAQAKARACKRIRQGYTDTTKAYKAICQYIQGEGYLPEAINPARNLIGALNRMCHHKWWKRRIETHAIRTYESLAINNGLVHRQASCYISPEIRQRMRIKEKYKAEFIESFQAINEEGDIVDLKDLINGSVSNPKIRRAELMVRISGFEKYSMARGDQAVFLTITCPSRFHAVLSESGEVNPQYDTSSPRDGQNYLRSVWNRIRAKLHRQGMRPYGFRVAEPHHDGTPHWHLLLFCKPDQMKSLISICQAYALLDNPEEYGADKYRFKAEMIDPTKGTATGYIAKYISKNIDGYGLSPEEFGEQPQSTAEDVQSWAKAWGIRQFQQIGGPPVTVWRELRKIRTPITDSEILEEARMAADDASWSDYIHIMGGTDCARTDLVINLYKEWSDREGLFGEPIGELIFGVYAGEIISRTRIHSWQMIDKVSLQSLKKNAEQSALSWPEFFKQSGFKQNPGIPFNQGKVYKPGSAYKKPGLARSVGILAYKQQAAYKPLSALTWSSVNNCTHKSLDLIVSFLSEILPKIKQSKKVDNSQHL